MLWSYLRGLIMHDKIQFYEKSVNGVMLKGYYVKTNREQIIGEIMVKIYELSEKYKNERVKNDSYLCASIR